MVDNRTLIENLYRFEEAARRKNARLAGTLAFCTVSFNVDPPS